jgi:hypothetical protein
MARISLSVIRCQRVTAVQVENIGVQIEQPFEVLPLSHFCANIKKHILDMVNCHAEARKLAGQLGQITPSPSQMVRSASRPALSTATKCSPAVFVPSRST